jgi:hypothetical protein
MQHNVMCGAQPYHNKATMMALPPSPLAPPPRATATRPRARGPATHLAPGRRACCRPDGGHKALGPPSLAGAATTSRRLAAQAAHGELLSHLPPARGSVTCSHLPEKRKCIAPYV